MFRNMENSECCDDANCKDLQLDMREETILDNFIPFVEETISLLLEEMLLNLIQENCTHDSVGVLFPPPEGETYGRIILGDHSDVNRIEKPFYCAQCNTELDHLKVRMNASHMRGNCSDCDGRMNRSVVFEIGQGACSRSGQTYTCKVCEAKFMNLEFFKEHLVYHR